MRLRGTKIAAMVALLIALSIARAGASECDSKRSVCPAQGFVPDEKTAIRIAEAVLLPIYGEKQLKEERPFVAHLEGGRWIVRGTLTKSNLPGEIVVGGTATAEIRKSDGRVLAVYHGK